VTGAILAVKVGKFVVFAVLGGLGWRSVLRIERDARLYAAIPYRNRCPSRRSRGEPEWERPTRRASARPTRKRGVSAAFDAEHVLKGERPDAQPTHRNLS
jgi:hypothetical protein